MLKLLVTLLQDRTKFAAQPRRLKVTLLVILACLVLVLATYVVNDMLEENEAVIELRGRLQEARTQNAKIRHEVDQYAALQQRYEAVKQSGILATLDPAGVVTGAEQFAQAAHLRDMRYRFEPEALHALTGSHYQLGSNAVSFDSKAITDIEALAFWDQLLKALPAHYQVTSASLERISDIDAGFLAALRQHQPVSGVSVRLTFQWISLHNTAVDTP